MREIRCRYRNCRIIFTPTTNGQKYHCPECKEAEAKLRYQEMRAPVPDPPKKKVCKKKILSINEILALGRKHNIYGYGNIVAAIEKGEIK